MEHNKLSKKMEENEIQIEPEVEKRLQAAYNKMSKEDKDAGLLPEEMGIQIDYRDINGNYIEDRFDPNYEPDEDPREAAFMEKLRLRDSALEKYAGSDKKYALTEETTTIYDEGENAHHLLHRIVALKDIEIDENRKVTKGELGGFIESEENLSQEGNCWLDAILEYEECVDVSSMAYGNSKILDDAFVGGFESIVSGNAKVCEEAIVWSTNVCDNAEVGKNAIVSDSCIAGDCIIAGDCNVENIEIIGGSFSENIKISEEQIGSPFLYGDIENLKSEIAKLEDSIDDFKIQSEEIPLVKEKIQEKYMELHKQTEIAYKDAKTFRKEHPQFLKSINLDKINDVYIHRNYSAYSWLATVHMNDFIEMKRKKGLNALEFKYCDISSVLFNEKFEGCKFERCSLFGCTLENAEFVNTTFKNVNFYNSMLQNVKFENCKFENCRNFDSTPQMEKSVNIEFVNTDIKDSRIAFDRTNIDLKSVCFKNCTMDNLKFSINEANFDFPTHCQLITKNVKEQSLRKLMDRNIRKSLKQRDDAAMPMKKQKKAKCR